MSQKIETPPRIHQTIHFWPERGKAEEFWSLAIQVNPNDQDLEIHLEPGENTLVKRELTHRTWVASIFLLGAQPPFHIKQPNVRQHQTAVTAKVRIFARAVAMNNDGLRKKLAEPWVKPYITNLTALIRQALRAEILETTARFLRALDGTQLAEVLGEMEKKGKKWRGDQHLSDDAVRALHSLYLKGLEVDLTGLFPNNPDE